MLKKWFNPLVRQFFPRRCAVCGNVLHEEEDFLCLACNMNLPRTGFHLQQQNPVEKLSWPNIPLQHATAFFYYRKGSDFRTLLHLLKYGHRRDLGVKMGRMVAAEIKEEMPEFFEGVDVLVPVPLHPMKMRMRGYNQSSYIAKGISEMTGIPVENKSVVRLKNNDAQSATSLLDRWQNVEGIFALHRSADFTGKHVLIVDDVLTTGSTLTACGNAFSDVPDVKISFLALCKSE